MTKQLLTLRQFFQELSLNPQPYGEFHIELWECMSLYVVFRHNGEETVLARYEAANLDQNVEHYVWSTNYYKAAIEWIRARVAWLDMPIQDREQDYKELESEQQESNLLSRNPEYERVQRMQSFLQALSACETPEVSCDDCQDCCEDCPQLSKK